MKKRGTVGELYLGNENLKEVSKPRVNKLTKNGAITIPANLRKELGINHNDKFEIAVDPATGKIELKRIAGVDALSPITENLVNYNGRKISLHSIMEITMLYTEIVDMLDREYKSKTNSTNIVSRFEDNWAEGDTFLTNPVFRESAFLRSLESRTTEIKDAMVDQEKAKAKAKKTKKKNTPMHILDRVTPEEAKTLFKKREYEKLLKEYNELRG